MAIASTPSKRGQQYPFRSRTPKDQDRVNKLVNAVMEGVDDMLYKIVRRRVHNTRDDQWVAELVQKCRVWLWQKSLPKFDAWRGVKASTFIYRCAANFINQEVRSHIRQQDSSRRVIIVDPDMMLQNIQDNDCTQDQAIENIANDVLTNPEKYLTESQVIVFKAIINNPKVQMKDLARQLGYQRASSLSMMLRRIRERIAEIEIEDHCIE